MMAKPVAARSTLSELRSLGASYEISMSQLCAAESLNEGPASKQGTLQRWHSRMSPRAESLQVVTEEQGSDQPVRVCANKNRNRSAIVIQPAGNLRPVTNKDQRGTA